jgi:hypothetical protein
VPDRSERVAAAAGTDGADTGHTRVVAAGVAVLENKDSDRDYTAVFLLEKEATHSLAADMVGGSHEEAVGGGDGAGRAVGASLTSSRPAEPPRSGSIRDTSLSEGQCV